MEKQNRFLLPHGTDPLAPLAQNARPPSKFESLRTDCPAYDRGTTGGPSTVCHLTLHSADELEELWLVPQSHFPVPSPWTERKRQIAALSDRRASQLLFHCPFPLRDSTLFHTHPILHSEQSLNLIVRNSYHTSSIID